MTLQARTDIAGTPVPWRGICFGLAAAAIWGAWPVASRYGVQQSLGALDITFIRFAVAGAILLPVLVRRGCGQIGWLRAVLLSLGAGAPYVLVSVFGLEFAPAGHAGIVIPGVMLTASILGGWYLLGDRPDRHRWLGLAAILSGLLLLGFASGGAGTATQSGLAGGHLLFAVGGVMWASYTVLVRRWQVEPVQATALVSVLSFVGFAPYYLFAKGTVLLAAPVGELLFQAVAQGLFAGVLALIFYTKAVAALGAARGALFAALVPGLAMVFAYPVLGEVPGPAQVCGLVLATGGMLLALGVARMGRLRR